MSSMRPPILAGPIERNTKRFSIGSVDQFTGVGVGLASGVGVAVGDWFCVSAFAADFELSALTANAPSVTTTRANETTASSSPVCLCERQTYLIGGFLSIGYEQK